MTNEIVVILPAYNEESEIEKLVNSWREYEDLIESRYGLALRILLVNDGSRDGTKEVGKQLQEKYRNFKMISHLENRGLGAALKTGFYHVLREYPNARYICVMDCDNTHHPKYSLEMLKQIERKKSDVVIASRYQKGSEVHGVSGLRLFMSNGARWFYTLLWGIPGVRDYTCGYRLYRVDFLRTAVRTFGERLIVESGFTCMAELLYKLSWIGAKISEVPFSLHYESKTEKSKMKLIKTVFHSVDMAFALRNSCQTIKTVQKKQGNQR